ncbi:MULTISPECIES: hypothetical protein [unclassified Arthrobacter]|uniref:hypothetical protein n=1 Tax=unclassified Arthrobacter TaxID=235627 RepID=UPI00159E2D1D|nr:MULTISPECIES: hypothetical protein [unclassified Arthrobacter]MCQ9165251.1 hypothetical protein [Arthrobacter sp. STN4]NVM99553.1 hypothetical protein [Arthrobacter sp. SDTb3-6]
MDFNHLNYYLLVYIGTLMLGLLMFAIMTVAFVSVTSVVAVIYSLVGAARRITEAAVKARPVVSGVPAVLRHSSRTIVVQAPRARPVQERPADRKEAA